MIRFDHVSKQYSDGTRAVDDFTAEVPTGRTLALVGSSGCGKTTLLRMVNRMVDPTAGRVLIDEIDVAQQDPVQLRRSIGYVLQNAGLMPHRKVLHNILTVPRLRREDLGAARERAMELMERVGLAPGLADRYPSQLSGGQRQRVGVARALVHDPEILLMDEPFGAVDPVVRGDLQRLMRSLQDQLGKTVLFVTHDIDEAFALADRVMILQEGAEVAQAGTPAEILTEPADEFVRSFIGADKDRRTLRVRTINGRRVALDAGGRLAGLVED